MFRTSMVRIHRILVSTTPGACLCEKLQPGQSQCTLQRGILNVRYIFRGIAAQTEAAGSLCMKEPPGTQGQVQARNSSLPKKTAESAGSEFLKRTLLDSQSISKGVVVNCVPVEQQLADIASGNHEEKGIWEETVDNKQATRNSGDNQGEEMGELSSFEKEGGQDHELPEAIYALERASTTDSGEMDRMASLQASALLQAALDAAEEDADNVRKEEQRSLRVAVVGAPNAGKSLLTNKIVGSRVSAVSRKTNTTHREHLGVYTKGDTQLCFYDTPGLHLDVEGTPLRVDARNRVQSAWQIVDNCEAVIVLVDAERQIRRPDSRVKRLVEKIGKEQVVDQKKILCLNKVDLIEQKRLLLPLAKEFEDLPAYDRIFMISSLTGSGVNDVKDYLLEQAIESPWEEDPDYSNHRDVALEIVREQVFEHLHEELPHTTKQKLVSWKVLKDGSVRILQLLLVAKREHKKILVGKNGAVIGEIGIKARKELSAILGVNVHLVLDVKYEEEIE